MKLILIISAFTIALAVADPCLKECICNWSYADCYDLFQFPTFTAKNSVRKLTMFGCALTSLSEVTRERYPNLHQLNFIKCGVSCEEIYELENRWPELWINADNCTGHFPSPTIQPIAMTTEEQERRSSTDKTQSQPTCAPIQEDGGNFYSTTAIAVIIGTVLGMLFAALIGRIIRYRRQRQKRRLRPIVRYKRSTRQGEPLADNDEVLLNTTE